MHFDETAVPEDSLVGEKSAAATGASSVAVKVDHYASRRFTTAVIALSSDPARAPHPKPAVIFSARSGLEIRRKMESCAPKGVNFFFSPIGKMAESVTQEYHLSVGNCPPPIVRATSAVSNGGYTVSLWNAYARGAPLCQGKSWRRPPLEERGNAPHREQILHTAMGHAPRGRK